MNEEKFQNFVWSDFLATASEKLIHFAIQLTIAILVFYTGRFILRKIANVVKRILVRRKVEASIATFVHSAIETVLYFILIIAVIGILGIETSSFVALFASAGVAIGMALSGTLQNFAGGVLVLLLRPYSVGDYIEAQGYAGTVKAIKMFHTILTTPDNKTIIIPNGPLSNSNINNYSGQTERRLEWKIGVAYGTEFEHAKSVIASILDSIPEIDHQTPAHLPGIFIDSLADSAVIITARAWVNVNDYWNVHFKVNELIYSTLPQNGIEFPFPQMDVHVIPPVEQNGSK